MRFGSVVFFFGVILTRKLSSQRRSPRRLDLKHLACKPVSPRKCPVLGSRTALFFDVLKMGQGHDQFCVVLKNAREVAKKILKTIFILENARNFGAKTFSFFFFFFEITSAFCTWSLASRGFVLGRAVLGLGLGFFCVLVLGLKCCVLDSTSVCSYWEFCI